MVAVNEHLAKKIAFVTFIYIYLHLAAVLPWDTFSQS